jgi:hypothetical protein
MRTALLRALLLALGLCDSAVGQSADGSAASGAPVGFSWELGLAHVDARPMIVATMPVFLVPGVEVATRGPVFAYAGVRGLLTVLPVTGSGGDHAVDSAGNPGFRRHGEFSLVVLRAGVGAQVLAGPSPVTLHASGGSYGVGRNARGWAGGGVGVGAGPRRRFDAEVAWSRNYYEDHFFARPWEENPPAGLPYTRRTDVWLRRMQIGMRFGG